MILEDKIYLYIKEYNPFKYKEQVYPFALDESLNILKQSDWIEKTSDPAYREFFNEKANLSMYYANSGYNFFIVPFGPFQIKLYRIDALREFVDFIYKHQTDNSNTAH